ncbi:hypothetical protein AEA09_17970 [Lysinibacillus contaminans]|uniref:Uncharacterized protein n=1 Tax=Lysinibacillus contaminans TaxID=1293441 RepID=A0ABR5JY91_9BACI|nr:hypothetical protein AEA09_17970 [Lysinibacillus contaminans]
MWDCFHEQMIAIGTTIAREVAKFIPAKIVTVQHIEHAYEYVAKAIHTKKLRLNVGNRHCLPFNGASQVLVF